MSRTEQEREVNKDVRTHLDSVVRHGVQVEMERLLHVQTDREREVILFDTDKPAVDSTGYPPVRAIVRERAKSETSGKATGSHQAETERNVWMDSEDRSIEQTETTVREREQVSWWESLKRNAMRILLFPVFILALWGVYKLIKLFQS